MTLTNPLIGFRAQLQTEADGTFHFQNLPLQGYSLTIEVKGFKTIARQVEVRSNVPVNLPITMAVETHKEQVTVSVIEQAGTLDVEATGTRTALSAAAMEHMPIAVGSRGVEAVLLSFPGFAQNANGAIHPRGAHNQMTYVVDGLPISDQLTGAFANSLDTSMVQTIELFTGNIPSEFGSKVSGVASITTKSGLGTQRKFTGDSQVSAGSFNTLQNITQVGGETGKFGYFASINLSKTNRYLDQVSLDNLHNGGNSERGFLRLDYQLSERDSLRFNVMAGRSSFQLANLRSQEAAGQDQRQLLSDGSLWLSHTRTLNSRSVLESTVAYRTTVAQLFPSAGDTPVTAAQARHLSTFTTTTNYSLVHGSHTLRAGAMFQAIPVSENFGFGITRSDFNDPASEQFNEALLPYDLTRGGRWFQFSERKAGQLYSGYASDTIRWQRFTLSLGLRYDNYRFLVQGNQLQPRVGLAYHLKETKSVLRASYNRNYQTPPNENLLLSSSEAASQLTPQSVRNALGNTYVPIRPERQDVYEVGWQQSLPLRLNLNASYYHKDSRDQQDNNNFFDTGIIFPVTLKAIRVNGVEARLVVPEVHGFTGSLSVTHARAVSSPPFTGGLFLGQDAVNLLTSGPFVIDHDQNLGMHGVVQYSSKRHFWISSAVRYDSGLVSNPSDPAVVAKNPDFSDLLPYVNLTESVPRVRPRIITDVSIGYERVREGKKRWDVLLQINNLTNKTALFNFQSVFVGTRLVAPRSAGVKLRFYW